MLVVMAKLTGYDDDRRHDDDFGYHLDDDDDGDCLVFLGIDDDADDDDDGDMLARLLLMAMGIDDGFDELELKIDCLLIVVVPFVDDVVVNDDCDD